MIIVSISPYLIHTVDSPNFLSRGETPSMRPLNGGSKQKWPAGDPYAFGSHRPVCLLILLLKTHHTHMQKPVNTAYSIWTFGTSELFPWSSDVVRWAFARGTRREAPTSGPRTPPYHLFHTSANNFLVPERWEWRSVNSGWDCSSLCFTYAFCLFTSTARLLHPSDLEVNFAGRGLFDSALGPVPIVDPIPAPGPVRSTNDWMRCYTTFINHLI